MKRSKSRVGIERKILTSILWVGVLPMAVALIVGYISARGGQRSAVNETLMTAAVRTAEALEKETESRLNMAHAMSIDRDVISLVMATIQNDPAAPRKLTDQDVAPFAGLLALHSVAEADGEAYLSVYNADRRLVAAMDIPDNRDDWTLPTMGPRTSRPKTYDKPQYVDFGVRGLGDYTAFVAAPVSSPATDDLLGYIVVESGITSLLQYALGADADSDRNIVFPNRYQIVLFPPSGGPITTRYRVDRETGQAAPALIPANDQVVQRLSENSSRGLMEVENLKESADDPGERVLLAYQRLEGLGFEDLQMYFLAYRPVSMVFSKINNIALLAFLGCTLFIAVLCVNAYRDVHNNIVRPVSLLNEGAQIIRQGDFDLKLKIGTGDEIEELAQSFNQMAVALNRNVERLEASEEQYRKLVNSMRDGIFQTDQDANITFVNPAAMRILGFDQENQVLGSNLKAMFVDDVDWSVESGALDLASDEREQVWMLRRDGRKICVELRRNRLIDEAGRPVGVEGTLRDITKNVQLEEEARERSERISAINQIANVINSSLEAGRLYESLVAELKKLLAFDYASVALLSESGLEFDARQLWPEEPVGPGHTFTLDPQHSYAAWVSRERRFLLIDDLQDSPSPFKEQFPSHIRSCLCVPLYATGRIIGTLNLGSETPGAYKQAQVESLEQMAPHLAVAIRNAQLLVNLQLSLEEVSRAREKLALANDELKTLDELKTNLLSNVSHELRTPLVSVMGYTDMLLNGKAGPLNQTQHEYLDISLRNVEKLVTLIENLLDFSRLHRGDERLVFDTFDLIDCARTSIQVVKPLAEANGVTVTLHAPEGEEVLVDGDKGKIGQVFNNLLSNAVKFNREEGTVDVHIRPGMRDVEVVVEDTGIGIPKEGLDKIFTRFYQYDDSSTRKYGGTGIGLAIVHDIVRLHGSTISVQSEPQKGSTFRFTLGLAQPRVPASDGVTPDTHLLVQVVSTDRALMGQVRRFLQGEHMDMIQATDPERAVALQERHSPDCIVYDAVGGQLDRQLLDETLGAADGAGIPVLFVCNDDELFEQYRGRVAARIRSGFRQSTLLSGLHNAINRPRAASEPLGGRVLCVDDDEEIQQFIERVLEAEGYVVEPCGSGEEALRRLEKGDFGLVLLDIAMPGMDGWETCRQIRSRPELAGTMVYLVTAKPVDRDTAAMQECGADGFLLKPFRPEDLVQLVRGLELPTVAK